MEQALWGALAVGLLPVAALLILRINQNIHSCAVCCRAGKLRWLFPEETIRQAEDPFGYWIAIGFNVFVLLLVVATMIAAVVAAARGQGIAVALAVRFLSRG
jgi:hypothetical protein